MSIVNRCLRASVVFLLAAMVIVVSWQVLSRYLLSSPSPWTEEMARIILIWLGFLGAAFAHSERAHLGIDLLEQSLSQAPRAVLQRIVNLLCALFAVAVLVIGGSILVELTWTLRQTTAVLGIPMAAVYLILPISGLIITVQSLFFAARGVTPA